MKELMKKAGKVVSDNLPAILTSCGVSGVISTIALTAIGTLEANEAVQNKKKEVSRELEKKEYLEVCWKPALPAIISGILTGTCIIASNCISSKRAAVLSSLYSLSETALNEYKNKVVEKIGEKKEERIRDEIAQSKVDHYPPNDWEIFDTGHGTMVFYDTLSGRFFRSSVEFIRQTQNEINKLALDSQFALVNDLYVWLGLPEIELGKDLCWNPEHKLDMHFTSKLNDNETDAYTVITYKQYPVPNYPF